MQSEAGRAKVNDCIISKLINTDNKKSTLLLEDFVLIFLLWLLSVACITVISPDKVHGLDLEQCCDEGSKKFVLRRFSVVK